MVSSWSWTPDSNVLVKLEAPDTAIHVCPGSFPYRLSVGPAAPLSLRHDVVVRVSRLARATKSVYDSVAELIPGCLVKSIFKNAF